MGLPPFAPAGMAAHAPAVMPAHAVSRSVRALASHPLLPLLQGNPTLLLEAAVRLAHKDITLRTCADLLASSPPAIAAQDRPRAVLWSGSMVDYDDVTDPSFAKERRAKRMAFSQRKRREGRDKALQRSKTSDAVSGYTS